MSNLKDTDIDDLFRRASEKYPLRTDSSDWDRMAAALEKDPPLPDDETDATDRRRKRRFFWLFLLLPLGVGGLGYYAWHTGTRTQAAATARASAVTNTTATANTSDNSNLPAAGSTPAANTTAAANTPSATETRAANPSAATATPTPAPIAPTTTGQPKKAGHQPVADGHLAEAGTGANAQTAGTNTSVTGANTSGANTSGNDNPGNDNRFSTSLTQNSLTQNRQDRLFYDLLREPVDRNYQLNVNVVAPAAKKDSSAAKQKTTPKTKTSYLYAGLIVAPDISTVKMQAVKEVGNTFGALVGYAFNSHWAIETGAYLERKKYYTEGQYFSKGEVGWLNTITLNNVNGTCNMWEIPLNLRYTFNPASKTRWFATAGFTTYLMTKENYTYNYTSSGWTDDSNRTIKKPSQYPFSIIGLSAGFEQRLGKIGNLRIEPYLRIPLTGMGAGKLPIMSTGINIGITRQLWKK
jgi:cytoskeletal protein RodZ